VGLNKGFNNKNGFMLGKRTDQSWDRTVKKI
ncbi:uncharacterized protein METZ01_LOCUS496106, partial [marine metagenome]